MTHRSPSCGLAIAAAAALAGCPDTQIDREAGVRGDPRTAGVRSGESDQRELAHRLGAPDTSRLPVGPAPASPEPSMSADPVGQPEATPSFVEGVSLGDMASFERRLRESLDREGLTLAAAIDLQGAPPSRLFVVTPGAPSRPGHLQSPVAEAALQHARLVVAYADADEPERVHVAYLAPQQRAGVTPVPRQYDARVDRAIHRAADGGR